jgi:hypothetical protein
VSIRQRLEELPPVFLVLVERLLVVRRSKPVRHWLKRVHRDDPAAVA